MREITIGVLALQGAFNEHIQLLRQASQLLVSQDITWTFLEIRTPEELARCDALIIPGGESTTMSLVAERSGMLEPLREFVKVHRNPTWGTCAGLILLSESANRTSLKKGGQELIGGLDVRINRNHFGRQTESFQADLDLPFLSPSQEPFRAIFIRAPIVEKILSPVSGPQISELTKNHAVQDITNEQTEVLKTEERILAPSREIKPELRSKIQGKEVEIMGTLPPTTADEGEEEEGKIIAVRQANCFGTSFHPELTGDPRIHVWWLGEVLREVGERGR